MVSHPVTGHARPNVVSHPVTARAICLSCEITKKKKSAQLGVKSVNIKFIGHEFQFDPSFIPLSYEITKKKKKKKTNWA